MYIASLGAVKVFLGLHEHRRGYTDLSETKTSGYTYLPPYLPVHDVSAGFGAWR